MVEDKVAPRGVVENKSVLFQEPDDFAGLRAGSLRMSLYETQEANFSVGILQVQRGYQSVVVGRNRFVVLS